jgi:rare lipoprotein A
LNSLVADKEAAVAVLAPSSSLAPAVVATPTAAQVDSPTNASNSVLIGAGDVWLQLGAFGSQAAAETFKTHVVDDVAVTQAQLAVQASGKVWRVRLGPFKSREAASLAADKLAAIFPQRPVIAH